MIYRINAGRFGAKNFQSKPRFTKLKEDMGNLINFQLAVVA